MEFGTISAPQADSLSHPLYVLNKSLETFRKECEQNYFSIKTYKPKICQTLKNGWVFFPRSVYAEE